MPYACQAAILLDRSPRRLIVKARQIGMSQTIALEAVHTALYEHDSTILFVSRNQDLAANLLAYCRNAIAGITDPPTEVVKNNDSEMTWANGSRILSLPANEATGRGFAAKRVYLDEFAYMSYASEIYRSVSPTVGLGGRLTILSTPDGRANHFYQLWLGIEAGEWSRHLIPWRQCPAYDAAWYERERPKYTASQWASEYEASFEASGQSVFSAADVDACKVGWKGLQSPHEHRQYVTAWDIGRRHDATVGITLDVTDGDYQVVAYARMLDIPFPAQQRLIEQRYHDYPGVHIVEGNNQGDPVIENLNVNVYSFTTTAKSKDAAITALALAHQNHVFKHDIDQLILECQLYERKDAALIQDSVMAAAIAVYCARPDLPEESFTTYEDRVSISPF